MKKIITLLLILSSCASDEICYTYESDDLSIECERCFENDIEYNQWFIECGIYVFLDNQNQAVDSLCNCTLK